MPFRLKRRPEERTVVLGQIMDMVKPEEVLHFMTQCVETSNPAIIANHNAHSLYLLRRDADFAGFYGLADMVEVDSLPLLIWARRTGRRSRTFHRCTYLDWRNAFWALAARKGWKVFYLGGAPGVAQTASQRLSAEFPGVSIAVRDGYFNVEPQSAENQAVLAEIRDFKPDILLVGMGMPRQELWIKHNHAALPGCVTLPVGAAFDYEAGVQKAAPRWMGRVGVEWLFRLFSDPVRLYRRYCVEPWFLLDMLVEDAIAARRDRREAARQDRRRQVERRAEARPGEGPRGRRASDQRRPAAQLMGAEFPAHPSPEH